MGNFKKCCVIFVTHKSSLTGDELKSFQQCLNVFSSKRDIKLVIPDNISTEFYDKFSDKFEYCKVNHEWLDSIESYNNMSCNKEFWKLFVDYEYALIYQTDCWVFKDELDYFIELGYDWYGAPWPFLNNKVGNSGLCLRNVNKMLEITEKYNFKKGSMHDDVWFCNVHKNDMSICPWEDAVNFSLEIISDELLEKIKKTPMGFHGNHLIGLWDDTGNKFLNFKKNHKKNNKIGIITINLNNGDGLEKTIESVIKQTYKNYEFIIIDGGSTDNSLDVIKKYEKHITYWTSEKDNGIYNAMNKGIGKCNSDYLIFLNSGDYFYENSTIEKIHPNLFDDIVYGDLLIHNNSKTFVKYYKAKINKEYFLSDTLPHQGSFIKKELFDDCKYNENYKIISDWIFFFENIINKNRTYLHLPYIISNYSLGGISSNVKELFDEKKKYLNIESKNNLDIYICTHKDFTSKVKNPAYKIVWGNKINYDLTKNGLKDDFYSELYQFKFVNENVQLKKYVGFCHYRRYFSFMDNIPDMDEIFKNYDIIIGKPIQCKSTIKEQYSKCHSIEDLYIIGGIIADKYPSYSNAWHNFLNGNIFIPYNMFIMKSEDFKEYIKFVFDIMDEYIKIVGTDIRKRIENNKEKYLKSFYPNNTVDYQYRIGGYIAERLTNLFIMTHFKKMKAYPIVITENKYRANEKSS